MVADSEFEAIDERWILFPRLLCGNRVGTNKKTILKRASGGFHK